MKQQSCIRDFTRYTILSVLGTLGVSCYILADTFFVSKGLGTNGLTALNLAIPVYNFIHGTGLMLGMGGATRFSVCKSQGKEDEVNWIYTNTLYLAVVFSAVFILIGVIFSKQLALLLGADTSVLEMTNTYLRWLLIFAPAFILNEVLLCFVRNDGSPQLSMTAMLIGSFSNIVLDYIFIFPMQMGIFGAVFATGLSPIISITMMLPHWIGKKNTFRFIKTKIRKDIIGQDLSLGFPSLLAQLSSGIVMIVFNAIILKLEGNTGVAAYGVVANISLVIVAIYTGIAQGVQPLLSAFYGVGNDKQARTVLRYAMITMLTVSCVVYLLIFVFAQPITVVFNSENNMKLQQIAVAGLKLYFLSMPFVGYNIILANYFTSVEKALPAHILSILRGLILIIPMAFILSALWKMTGVWLTYPITESLTALLGFVIYKYKNSNRKEQCIMKIEETSALLVIDIQQEDFKEMTEDNMDDSAWDCIRNAKRVLDVFRAKKLPVIQVKEVHRPDMVDFGRELDGSEDVHCIESSPYTDYADLTYPIEGEYLISKRRYSAFFSTDLEILLKGLRVDTLYLIGGLTDVCIHYTAVDAHQHDYHFKVVTDACNGSGTEAHNYALKAMQYLQRDALITVADVESAL